MIICIKYFNFLVFFMLCREINSNLYKTRNRRSQARTLTFPVTAPTRVQFIGGIGIPVEDLLYEAVTSGYVLKAEYFLPEKAEDFRPTYLRPQNVQRRNAVINETLTINSLNKVQHNNINNNKWKKQVKHDGSSNFNSNLKSQQKYASTYRWVVYKAIEVALTSSGLPGKVCMLRSICEHAAAPMHFGAGILAELLHIILTPSTSHDKFSNPLDKEYLHAENIGYSGRNCELEFQNCTKSPMDLITAVFDLDNLYF